MSANINTLFDNIATYPKQTQQDLEAHKTYLTPLPALGVLSVSGRDAQKFLQGQLSCDLNKASPQQSLLGAYCNIKGRVLTSFILMQASDDCYYLIMAADLLEKSQTTLAKYAMFSKVTLAIATELCCIGIIGQQIPNLFNERQTASDIKNYQTKHTDNYSVIAIDAKPSRALIIIRQSQLATLSHIINESVQFTQPNLWQQLEITSKLAHVCAATSEQHTPHDIGLVDQHAVSFDKGCYLGQEIVARMQYLGKAKKHVSVCTLHGQSTPQANQTITVAGKAKGAIMLVAEVAADEYLALIVMREIEIASDQTSLATDEGWQLDIC